MLTASLLLAALSAPQADTPDLIVLKDGEEIECRVLFEDDEIVVYTERRKAEELARSEVASVQSIERSVREYLDRFGQIPADDVEALLDLAAFCESRELLGEARHLRIRVLTLDPENERAWNELGGSYSERRGWRIKVRGRFLSMEQLRERVADWQNALELPTAHFLIQTDASPEGALDLAVDVERAYAAFYDLLGGVLRLYPFDEVPELRVYASTDEYPRPPSADQIAWFSPGENALNVDASRAQSASGAAMAELADLMLFNAMRRTVGKTGSMPAWARSAIDQAFGAAYRRDPGRASWDLSHPLQEYFVIHAKAEKPLGLSELLGAGWNSFEDGPEAELYRAQSYTLMHYLARGDGGAHRGALGEYLISAFRGQGAVTHLEKALDRDKKEIEADWLAYAQAQAGA